MYNHEPLNRGEGSDSLVIGPFKVEIGEWALSWPLVSSLETDLFRQRQCSLEVRVEPLSQLGRWC